MSSNYYTAQDSNVQNVHLWELPKSVQFPPNLGKDSCPWLDEFRQFSRLWSPRAYDLYHTACGLWVLSTIAARRVTTPFGKNRFTNLTVLMVARTGLWSKSTTAQIAKDIILTGGFGHLLLPDYCTPEKMVSMMTSRLPEGYDELPIEEKDKIKKVLPFVGQRGWYFDEMGMLFHAMGRRDSSMASFHGLLRKLDDTEETYQNATISRGNDIVQHPYLALLGCITPTDLLNVASPGSPFWSDGFFARYLFAAPPDIEPPDGKFPQGERVIPSSLLSPLQEWDKRLAIPKVDIHHGLVDIEHKPVSLSIDPDVIDGLYLYQDGLREMIMHNKSSDLDGNYIRLPEFALRISMLFASLSNSPAITLLHWAKAIEITEEFRNSLHYLYEQIGDLKHHNQTMSTKDKIIGILRKKGRLTVREISQGTGLVAGDIEMTLDELIGEGVVDKTPEGKTFRYGVKQ